MKSILKKIIVFILYYSGLNWLIGKFNSDKVFCLGYHSVWDEKNKEEFNQKLYWNISISTKKFEKQIVFLKDNGHTFIRFSDLKNPETKELSKPTIIFFDDGFKDVLVNALPILSKHNIPATIFITTGLIDKKFFLWTMSVRYLLLKKGMDEKEIENKIKKLKKLSITDREKEISEMFKNENLVLNPSDFNIFLNWEEINELSNNNFEVGSHGIVHQKLTDLDDVSLREELVNSKKDLERHIGKTVETISYPYGRSDSRVIECTKASGYSFGISGVRGFNSMEDISKLSLELKRMNPEECKTQMEFRVKLYANL